EIIAHIFHSFICCTTCWRTTWTCTRIGTCWLTHTTKLVQLLPSTYRSWCIINTRFHDYLFDWLFLCRSFTYAWRLATKNQENGLDFFWLNYGWCCASCFTNYYR